MILLMMVKRAVYYLFSAGPFLLIGLIAINSRLNSPSWEFIEYGPETSARIEAYIEPVADVRAHLGRRSHPSEAEVVGVADTWLKGYAQGRLKDIPPASTVDEATSGVYQQIGDARQILIDQLLHWADVHSRRGETHEAALLYSDVVQVSNIGKFSEFGSVANSAVNQTEALRHLAKLASRLDATDRALILDRLIELNSDPTRTLSHVVDRIAVAYQGDLRRARRAPIALVAAEDTGALASAADELASKIRAWEKISDSDDDLLSLSGRGRVAFIHNAHFQDALASAIAAYSPSVSGVS